MKTPLPSSQEGFVLPFLLVTIAMLSLAVFSVADVLDQSRLRTTRLAEQSRLELAGVSARERIAHLILTEPVSHRGLLVGGDRLDPSGLVGPPEAGSRSAGGLTIAELVFDGRRYRVPAEDPAYVIEIEIQDESGLLNFNGGDEAAIARLLRSAGLATAEARRLAASLSDYVDGDDLRRIDGAETGSYRLAGLPSPRNVPLRNQQGAAAALNWNGAMSPIQSQAVYELSTALHPTQRLNLNTAPAAVLGAVLGVGNREAETIVKEREDSTLQSVADVVAVTGTPNAGTITDVTGLPSRNMRVRISFASERKGGSRLTYETTLRISPPRADPPVSFVPPRLFRRIVTSSENVAQLPRSTQAYSQRLH